MAIELNTEKITSTITGQADFAASGSVKQGARPAPILGGAALKVVDGTVTDLEKLVARLKSENDKARFSVLLSSLASIGQAMTEIQKRTLEQGLALSEKLDELNKLLDGYSGEEARAKAEASMLQAKIDALTKQIEQAVKDGKEHNELVAEQKRVRAELAEKERVIADTQGKIAETKNEISSVKGQISAIVSAIGENEAKTIAGELATIADPEKAERPAEAEKEAAKQEAVDIFASIRESLAEIERDIVETIEENRVETV